MPSNAPGSTPFFEKICISLNHLLVAPIPNVSDICGDEVKFTILTQQEPVKKLFSAGVGDTTTLLISDTHKYLLMKMLSFCYA